MRDGHLGPDDTASEHAAVRQHPRRRVLAATGAIAATALAGCLNGDEEATLTVRVHDPAGDPLSGVGINVAERGTVWEPGDTVANGETGENGRFTATVPHGEHEVWVVWADDETIQPVEVDEGGAELTVEIDTGE